MVDLIVGAFNPAARAALEAMFRQRHKIFIEEKGWQLASRDGLEIDQYDNDETLYLLQYASDGTLIASMRMAATDRPFMVLDAFADMVRGPVPAGADIWELTRGALSPKLRKSKHYGHIICAVIEAALLWQVKTSIGLYSVDYIVKQTRIGLDLKPLGPPRIIDGEPHVVAEFPFDAATLQRVRASFGITRPVLERITYMTPEDRAAA
jgi:N-acyl-L-homoserine lactone synthetase